MLDAANKLFILQKIVQVQLLFVFLACFLTGMYVCMLFQHVLFSAD